MGGAQLELRYRYEPTSAAELVLYVDVKASGGSVGELVVTTELDGFEPLRGPARFTVSVADGHTESRQLTLRVLDTPTPKVTVVTTRAEGGTELARDTLRFIVSDMSLRECRPDDAPCAGG